MEDQTVQAAQALLLLRPRWMTGAAIVGFIDARLRPEGYRLIGTFEESGAQEAVAAVGFREMWSTA